MGQRVIVNGQVKELPKVFNSEDELAGVLDGVLRTTQNLGDKAL